MRAPEGCPEPTALKALVDGRLPPEEEDALATHLESCAICRNALEGLAAHSDSWAGLARSLQPERMSAEPALRDALAALSPTCVAETIPQTPRAGEPALDFLGPPGQPGSLGRLDCYEMLQMVGQGGMGMVFKAFDPSLQRVVAVKILAPHLASQASARQRFLREARAAAAVRHEQVVAIHAVSEFKGMPFLVMEYVAGTSLAERLAFGPLPLAEAVRIGILTARGLEAAHARGLVHRDVKPANILLEGEPGVSEPPGLSRRSSATGGRVKLTDFGLAQAQGDVRLTQSGAVAGTPMYMAPEQARSEAVDHRADLFSLGSVLYTMCTGRPPFPAGSPLAVLRRVADETPIPLREINESVPRWLAAIVAKLHARIPADRFGSAGEVADLMERHQADLRSIAPTQMAAPHQPPDMPSAAKPRRLLLAAAVAGLLTVMGLAGWRFGPSFFRDEPARHTRTTGPNIPGSPKTSPGQKGVTFRLDEGGPLPSSWQPTGAPIAAKDGLRLNDNHYVVTKAADYLNKDFRFEVVFTVKATGDGIAFIGLGEVNRDSPFNEPGRSLYLRIHPPHLDTGSVGLANGKRNGNLFLGSISRAGTHRVVIEKKGDAVTFSIDVDNDGPSANDFTRSIPDLKAFAPYLDAQNTRLFFGSGVSYRQLRLTERPSASLPLPGPVAQDAPPIIPDIPAPKLTGRIEIPLEAPFDQVRTGGAGRYLIFHLKKAKKLVVFDASQAKVTHRIDVPDEVAYAAGIEKLLIAIPGKRLLERWDLAAGRRETTAALPDGEPIRSALMGCNGRGPLLLLTGSRYIPWDVERMAPAEIDGGGLAGDPRWSLQARISADGQTAAVWPGGSDDPVRYALVRLDRFRNTLAKSPDGIAFPDHWAMPNADGSLVFRAGPRIYDSDMCPVTSRPFQGLVLLPTEDPRFFLAVREGRDDNQVIICTCAELRVAFAVKGVETMTTSSTKALWGQFQGEPRVHYLPSAGVLINLPESNDHVVMRPINLFETIDRLFKDYLFFLSRPGRRVAAGTGFRYRIQVCSRFAGLRYQMESGPKGMTVSDDGVVRWAVSRPPENEPIRATIKVRSASGKEARHTFELIVVGPAR